MVELSATDQALRLSMSLRGLRPTPDELQRVASDPAALDGLIDSWIESDEFGLTMRDLHNETLLLRTDTIEQLPRRGVMSDHSTWNIYEGTTEAPLRLIEWIITNDLPYTEIVQTEILLKSEVMSDIYGLPYDSAGDEWQFGQWDDGRPLSGILSSSEIWRRYRSAGQNNNRGRADFIAGRLLCEPFAERDIPTPQGVDLSDEQAVAEAVNHNPACAGCHQSLDPIASFLWGFQRQIRAPGVRLAYDESCHWPLNNPLPLPQPGILEDMCYPVRSYIPEREDDWEAVGLRGPAYFGLPGKRIDDLGRHVAADPRFASCTARRFWSFFAQESVDQVDDALVAELSSFFVASNYDAKALTRRIVTHERFLSSHYAPGLSAIEQELVPPVGVLKIRPEQLQRSILQLTGFQWWADPDGNTCGDECWGRIDLTVTDRYGFRVFLGGVDGINVTRPTHTITPTLPLALGRLAAEAGGFLVTNDLSLPSSQRLLLDSVELSTTDEGQIRAQLVDLHLKISAEIVRPKSEEVDATYGLWSGAYEVTGSTERAWALTIAALLQDARMLFY